MEIVKNLTEHRTLGNVVHCMYFVLCTLYVLCTLHIVCTLYFVHCMYFAHCTLYPKNIVNTLTSPQPSKMA